MARDARVAANADYTYVMCKREIPCYGLPHPPPTVNYGSVSKYLRRDCQDSVRF